jgi:hypothetical protein
MGIALRPAKPEFAIVDEYYRRAKREPTRRGDLEISRTDAFKPNFLDLVRMLVAKQQSHVVIVSHGGDDGLHLDLTDKTSDWADNRALLKLVLLVDEWPSLDAGHVKAYAKDYSISEAEVRALVQNCYKIRKHESNCLAVHIRGCKIGATTENLETIQGLFNSLVVSAPECPMLYATFHPDWSRPAEKDVDAWNTKNKAATRRREFYPPGSGLKRLVLDVNYAGSTSSTQGVVQRADDLAGWAAVVYANKNHGVQREMPIAAMWPENGYFLPQEQGYIDQLNAVRNA